MGSSFFITGPIPSNQIIGHYDVELVLLSYAIAVFASYIAFDIAIRLKEQSDSRVSHTLWLLGGAFAMGAGIWSMHFIGMLAFLMPDPMQYTAWWTITSMFIAVVASGFALYLFQLATHKKIYLALGGIFLGLGIASMHYTGMAAMQGCAIVQYTPNLFILSIIIAIAASEAALWIVAKSNQLISINSNRVYFKFFGALIMGAAICGMHYTGMAAAIFTPINYCYVTDDYSLVDTANLPTNIALVTSAIMLLAFFVSNYGQIHYRKVMSAALGQKEQELHLSEEKLKTILQATADGIIVVNQNKTIELCNHAACNILGYSLNELLKKNITHILKVENLDIHQLIRSNDTSTNKLYEAYGITNNDSIIPLELAISKIEFSNTLLTICMLRDISERKKHEQSISMRHEVARLLTKSASPTEAITDVLAIIGEKMQLAIGNYWKTNTKDMLLQLHATWRIGGIPLSPFYEKCMASVYPLGKKIPGKVWQEKTSVFVTDLNHLEDYKLAEAAKKANLQYAFSFPIILNNEVIGVFEFFSQSALLFDNSFIQMLKDLSEQIAIAIEREQIQKHIEIARQAGMADIAVSVLHNVGNILNSASVSVSLLQEGLENSHYKKLSLAINLMKENLSNNPSYLVDDPKGKLIPQYLTLSTDILNKEFKTYVSEIANLHEKIHHIKDIVNMQQSISRSTQLTEKIFLPQVIDIAIQMCMYSQTEKNITLRRNYEITPFILTDKSKLLQILINLIQNAKDAVLANDSAKKNITISIVSVNASSLRILVEDNGTGIAPAHLEKIFSFGFTTKERGHGYGLHSSALIATEIGGALHAESNGINQGATFILTIPLNK